MSAGILPGAAPPGPAHGQCHAEAGLHAQCHHRAKEAGRGPVRSRYQVGAAEDQGPAGRTLSLCRRHLSLLLDVSWEPVSKSVCLCLFKPDSDMDPNSSGEGVNSVSSIKRGLSVDSAQEVKRFRAATGAISAVRTCAFLLCTCRPLDAASSPCMLSILGPTAPEAAGNWQWPQGTALTRGPSHLLIPLHWLRTIRSLLVICNKGHRGCWGVTA